MKILRDFLPIKHKRIYKVVIMTTDGTIFTEEFGFDKIISDDPYEWENSLIDIIDEVDKMNVGEFLPFRPNRDNYTECGIIVRLK